MPINNSNTAISGDVDMSAANAPGDAVKQPKMIASGAFRSDSNPVSSVKKTKEGFLIVTAPVGKVGIVSYRQPDGSMRREFRPPEELFHADSIESLRMKPITNEHPPVPTADAGLLTTKTASKFSVGSLSNDIHAAESDGMLMATFAIHNDSAIKAIEGGKRQLSPGYTADVWDEPGIWNNQPYDCVQRSIRYNHTALTGRGRAGADVAIRLDSLGNEEIEIETDTNERGFSMSGKVASTVKLDTGIEYDVPPEVAAGFIAMRTHLDSVNAELVASKASHKSDTEKLQGELAATKTHLDSAQGVDINALISDRVALHAEVRKHVGAEVKLDSYDPIALKSAAIAVKMPGLSLVGKSAEFIDGVYKALPHHDSIVASSKAQAANVAAALGDGSKTHLDAQDKDYDANEARKNMIADQKKAFDDARKGN